PATIHASAGGSITSYGRPSGPRQAIVSPSTASYRIVVVTPMRLLSNVKPSTRLCDRSTSNTENGRRSSGSALRTDLTITNCPGCGALGDSGGASGVAVEA